MHFADLSGQYVLQGVWVSSGRSGVAVWMPGFDLSVLPLTVTLRFLGRRYVRQFDWDPDQRLR